MPRAPETLADRLRDRRREEPAVEIIVIDGPEAAAKAREEFEGGFKRSQKGNLWRTWQGMTLTVFRRDDDSFAWCVVDADGERRFSRGTYEDESDAIGGLADAVDLFD
jgi:hypothetical protein